MRKSELPLRFNCPSCNHRMVDKIHCRPCGGSGEGAVTESVCAACGGQGEIVALPYCADCDTDENGDLPADWGDE